MKQKAIAHSGYARTERERLILIDAGLTDERIYLEGRGAECLARIPMRQGELLATVGGLRALGDSRHDIVGEVRRFREMGAAIIDVETKWRSDQHGAEMLDRALARLKGEITMPPGKAQDMQVKSVRARLGKRMPQREALTYWRNPKLATGEAIKRMTGWSTRTAYVKLGKRGLPSGRMSKRD